MNRGLFLSVSLAAAFALAFLAPGCKEKTSPPAPDPLRDLTGAKAAREHTRAILSFGPRPPGSAALQKVQTYVITRLRANGWQAATQQTTEQVQGRGPVTFTNILARFGDPADPDLWKRPVKGLLAAHLDSKYYPNRRFLGADDAASAVGAILELARELAANPAQARQLELVFFDGEEAFGQNINVRIPPYDGLYGSRFYAGRWRTAARKPEFGIVLDMIGHKNLRIRYPSDSPPHLVELMLQAAEAEGARERFTRADTPIIDDHVPLNDAGIPTLDIIGDFSQFAWWHTDADNFAIISEESLAISLGVTRRMLGALLAKAETEPGSD